MISLFVCDKCGCVDAVACSPSRGDGWLCSECRTGSWHGIFEKSEYNPDVHHDVINRENHGYDEYGEVDFG